MLKVRRADGRQLSISAITPRAVMTRTIARSATVLLLHAAAGASAAAQPATLQPTGVTIGAEEEGETIHLPTVFVPVGDGILIVDDAGRQVRLFAPDGNFIARLGRVGGGPGEYTRITVAAATSNRIWLADLRSSRALYYDHDGAAQGDASARCLAANTCRIVAHDGDAFLAALPVTRDPEGRARPVPLLRVRTVIGPVDTVAMLRYDERRFQVRLGDGAISAGQPIRDRTLLATAADGSSAAIVDYAVTDGLGTLSLSMANAADGQPALIGHWRYTPRPVPDTWIANAADSLLDGIYSVAGPTLPPRERAREIVAAAIDVPEHAPPVLSAVMSLEGTIWLATDARDGATTWLEITQEGTCRRTLSIDNGHLVAVDDDHAWILEKSELDALFLRLYEIVDTNGPPTCLELTPTTGST